MDIGNNENAESYRILSEIFIGPPTYELIEAIKDDFELTSIESYDEIESDFIDLFQYPSGRLLPLASLYISGDRLDVINNITSFYASAGLIIDERFEIMPDHISLEFLFVSYLMETGKIDLMIKFFETHIMKWVPDYCDEVVRKAKTMFYREIAEITKEFLVNEYENLLEET